VSNATPYFLHVVGDDDSVLFLPPNGSHTLGLDDDGDLVVFLSPGQGRDARVDAPISCCDGSCGSIRFDWDPASSRILSARSSPECSDGSCPYVHVHDGDHFVLQGEALSGALFSGAERTDRVRLDAIRPSGGRYRVRVAAELRETDVVEGARLWVVDHAADVEIVVDDSGALIAVTSPRTPRRVTDGGAADRTGALAKTDGDGWKSRPRRLDGRPRDWIDLVFDPPDGSGPLVLLVRGRTTEFARLGHHAYLRRIGPGAVRWLAIAASFPGYRMMLDALIASAGHGLDVSVGDGGDRRAAGRIPSPGSAGFAELALPIEAGESEGGDVHVRIAAVPGAWEIDRVRLARRCDADPLAAPIDAASASIRDGERTTAVPDIEDVRPGNGRRTRIPHGRAIDLAFPAPPPAEDAARTVFLELRGYYEESPLPSSLAVDPAALFRVFAREDGFARFLESRWIRRHAARAFAGLPND
jgi:hypothetical protein